MQAVSFNRLGIPVGVNDPIRCRSLEGYQPGPMLACSPLKTRRAAAPVASCFRYGSACAKWRSAVPLALSLLVRVGKCVASSGGLAHGERMTAHEGVQDRQVVDAKGGGELAQ